MSLPDTLLYLLFMYFSVNISSIRAETQLVLFTTIVLADRSKIDPIVDNIYIYIYIYIY